MRPLRNPRGLSKNWYSAFAKASADEQGLDMKRFAVIAVALVLFSGPMFAQLSPGAGPSVVVVETEKGTFDFETYPNESPKSVAHVITLANKKSYNALRS